MQQQFWNEWNSSTREQQLDEVSYRQAKVVLTWLGSMGRRDLDILEVGCGSCWFCEELADYGQVTGTDLSNEVLARAQKRMPSVKLVSGDFMSLDFGTEQFDVVVSLEVLSHVEDQPAFVAKLAKHLRPNGTLMLATQNEPVLRKYNRLPPPKPGHIRKWVNRKELVALLEKNFIVMDVSSVTLKATRGPMRILSSRTFNRVLNKLIGDRFQRFMEANDFGWTLMARARKRPGS
ncbi:2-polyprenyl-3-methyl-5-hydroxy-6-metoxy-1,4-benzoquinol methylase [Phyllobacterium sp. 1468]|uniref:class I SAM-dependent methyltransferase n=1 Tax=Phyllobacterium sp. 1468 TaxID=2817759 RepID=UPI002860C1C0|nr:class I SAM-dependent methyltransferase [Phyllobacterium sp. 1468]MDR6631981.1 2-polyprenyl-3-methyl-5-hydroxy-6-metoxy-1,4-benzoquinol methylase [Phyllobacterium sp. 1468]